MNIHQQIMNFPFNNSLGLMAGSEAEMAFAGAAAQFPGQLSGEGGSPMEAMREMMFRVAAMQPVRVDPDSVRPRKRRNVRISSDPQSVAARHRRERISERIRILQRLVPGGTKMDTASMLEEAVRYLKFLKREVRSLEEMGQVAVSGRQGWPWRGPGVGASGPVVGHCVASSTGPSWGMGGAYSFMHPRVVE